MRRTGKQKLYGQRGASLLLALLLTLAASMVSMVIISASSTAVKRMYDDTRRQQDYLTLESAAKLLKAELEKTTYKTEADKLTKIRTSFQQRNGLLAKTIYDALSGVGSATFELPAPEGDLPFQRVDMDITMDEQTELSDVFYLTAEIHLQNSGAQKLFLTATSKLLSEEASESDPENALTCVYGFESVSLKTRLESVAS